MQKQVDIRNCKFQRSKEKEQAACDGLISIFKNKRNEEKEAKELAKLILDQISDAYSLVESTSETEEHLMLQRTRKYLNMKIDELRVSNEYLARGNTFEFDECIRFLNKIAQNASQMHEEQVKERLCFFINELKERFDSRN